MMEQLKIIGTNMDLPLARHIKFTFNPQLHFPFFSKFDREKHIPFIYITVLF